MSNHDNQIQTIDYRWIIQTLSRGEQGQEFFDLYSAINPNPYSYSESELYLHYFRLFNPVEYLHPTFDECDNNMWNMLLQLLFGNLTAECTLTHSTDNTLPELEFSYPPVGTMKCSELTTDILKPLLLCLLPLFHKQFLFFFQFSGTSQIFRSLCGSLFCAPQFFL